MFFTILLLALLFFFVVRPAWRVYTSVRRQQQATRDFFESMGFDVHGARTGSRQQQRRSRRQQTEQHQPPRKKKIDSSVGEYVKFEEVSEAESTYSETRSDGDKSSRVTIEQQVTDVEWEDIK